jgi:hypothetical protein
MKLKVQAFSVMFGVALLGASTGTMAAADRTNGAAKTDRIEVIAHYPLSGTPITGFVAASHWNRSFLYLERGTATPATILDVTNPSAPAAAGQLDVPAQAEGANLETVIGSAALVTSSPEAQKPMAPETVTVLSFSDPDHPRVSRQFAGVTAIYKDEPRGLVYLANADGLWVLRLQPAPNVAAEKAYLNHVLYNP